MRFKKSIKWWIIGVVVVLIVQPATYFLFAHRLLGSKLMTGLVPLPHSIDSAFVRDFFVTDCSVGDPFTYYSQNLTENEVKEKLGVKFVKFQGSKDFSWSDREESKYRIVYHTWTQYQDPLVSFSWLGLFTSTQVEYLRIDNKDIYSRETDYIWVLFFWLPIFEDFYVTPILKIL